MTFTATVSAGSSADIVRIFARWQPPPSVSGHGPLTAAACATSIRRRIVCNTSASRPRSGAVVMRIFVGSHSNGMYRTVAGSDFVSNGSVYWLWTGELLDQDPRYPNLSISPNCD